MISLALIINTYNQPDYLARVLNAVSCQTQSPEEVLLADDGSSDGTRDVFAEWAALQKFRREHVWQKNEGFRRSGILNQAIARTQSGYLVFLDGDTIPHPRFLADHAALAQSQTFVQGHRALIEQRAAEFFGMNSINADRRRALLGGQLRGLKHAYRWPAPLKKFRSDLKGVRGCNLAIWRDDLVRVNGYNEAFTGWGREDSELAVRLMNSGVRRRGARGVCRNTSPPQERLCHRETQVRLLL